MPYQLYAADGAGSAIVEAALLLVGADYEIVDAPPWADGPHLARLKALSPIAQVPVLVLPEGTVMNESAAMILFLAERYPAAGLAPPPEDPTRLAFLRWLIFLVASIYPTFTVGDDPARWVEAEAARAELRRSTDDFRLRLWRMVEPACAAPWFLGEHFSALDLYIATMVHWRPRMPWFAEHCPKLSKVATATLARADLGAVWQRNFTPSA